MAEILDNALNICVSAYPYAYIKFIQWKVKQMKDLTPFLGDDEVIEFVCGAKLPAKR